MHVRDARIPFELWPTFSVGNPHLGRNMILAAGHAFQTTQAVQRGLHRMS